MAPNPVLALIAPNGYTGLEFATVFANAVKTGELSSVRLISASEAKPATQKLVDSSSGKIELHVVKYTDLAGVQKALTGVDILVDTLSVKPESAEASDTVIKAAAQASVKVYFASEWGYDYDVILDQISSPIFDPKHELAKKAEALGLKTVLVATSAFLEMFSDPKDGIMFGADWSNNAWTISNDGNQPWAATSQPDAARYVLRAGLLAVQNPEQIPRRLRVYSENRTFNEYADIADRVLGKKLTRNYVPQAKLLEEFKAGTHPLGPLFVGQVARATKAGSWLPTETHIELLNPEQRFFVPTTFEEVLKKSRGL